MSSKKYLMIVIILFLHLGLFNNIVRAQDYITLDGGRTYVFSTPTPENNLESEPSSYNYYLVRQTSPIYDPMTFGDSDHDGNLEVYFTWQPYIKVWEFDKNLNYVESELPYYGLPWDIGDIDGNGLNDLIVQSGEPGGMCSGNGYLRIYEAPNLYSFPSILKAEIVMPNRKMAYYAKIVDTDNDGKKEILMSANYTLSSCGNSALRIYEWENGGLILKWMAPDIHYPTFSKAVGDFDGDNKTEIAVVETYGPNNTVYIFEYANHDNYSLIQSWDETPYDSRALISNLDGGNPELVIGGSYSPLDHNHYKWNFYKES